MQFDFGTIDPTTKSGTQLAADLMNWRDALLTAHRGASRPDYAQGGTLWVQEVSSSQWRLMLYTGNVDIQIGTFDPTTGVFFLTVAGATFTTIPQLPAVNPDSANDAVRKAYADALFDAALPKTGGTLTGPLVLPADNPSSANHAVRRGYVDGLSPASKTQVQNGAWAGVFDLLLNTPTTFFDLMLPANTANVVGSGWVNGLQAGGGGVNGIFQVALLDATLAVQNTIFHSIISNTGTENPWFNSGGRIGFNNIAAGNSGWRLRFQAYKDTTEGPFNVLGWQASILSVRR
jgi:hypothetical protein